MAKLLLLLGLIALVQILCTAQTSNDSAALAAKKTFNILAELYDGCQQQNTNLQAQIVECNQYEADTHVALNAADSAYKSLTYRLTQSDSIVHFQALEVTNQKQLIKVDNKLANHRLIGFSLGGFAFGIAITSIAFIILHH